MQSAQHHRNELNPLAIFLVKKLIPAITFQLKCAKLFLLTREVFRLVLSVFDSAIGADFNVIS